MKTDDLAAERRRHALCELQSRLELHCRLSASNDLHPLHSWSNHGLSHDSHGRLCDLRDHGLWRHLCPEKPPRGALRRTHFDDEGKQNWLITMMGFCLFCFVLLVFFGRVDADGWYYGICRSRLTVRVTRRMRATCCVTSSQILPLVHRVHVVLLTPPSTLAKCVTHIGCVHGIVSWWFGWRYCCLFFFF